MMDSSNLIEDPDALQSFASEQGYLYLAGLIPDALLDPVRAFTREAFARLGWVHHDVENRPVMKAIADARLSGRGWDDPDWVRFQHHFSSHPSFLALVEAPLVMNVVEAILGEPAWLASVNFCWIKLPGSPEHTTLPHQDEWYLPHCGSMWTAWMPLVDTPFEVGPLGVVPGSHKGDVQHHDSAFSGLQVGAETEWVSNEVTAGDVVFFSARTIHCAWSNVSPTFARLSADVRYEPRSVGRASKLRKHQ
jgi:ectoine hydroxylase-related dioxygenase (phytanoyl-CoA dioxygenase family)